MKWSLGITFQIIALRVEWCGRKGVVRRRNQAERPIGVYSKGSKSLSPRTFWVNGVNSWNSLGHDGMEWTRWM